MTLRASSVIAVLAAFMLVFACGDDEGNPQEGGSNPTASTLSATVSQNTATLTWTQNPDTDFASYNLYRSTTSGIAANPSSATLVATITNVGTLTHDDDNLDWNTPYYYALQTVDSSQLTAWSNEATITTPDSSGGGGGGGVLSCYEIQGQADESPYSGDDVTVTGIVTVGGDEYYSSTSGAQYSVLEDASGGEWSGLVLFGYDGVMDSFERGDSVVVSGYINEYYGLTELVVQTVDYRDAGHTVPSPESITTGDMSQEKWEGVLISFQDVTVTSDPTSYGEYFVDDGSGDAMADDKGVYPFSPSNGDTFSEMIGVVFYEYDFFRIQPRDESDIVQN